MAGRTPTLLTQADYARHRKARGLPGGSRVAVHKAVNEGRISLIGDKIDPGVADIQWEQNTRTRISPQAAAAAPAGGDLVDAAAAPIGTPSPTPTPAPASAPIADTGYNEARARRERADADVAEMNARKMRGELVPWEDVARGGFEVGRDLRDTMDAAVNALAAELAALPSAEQCAEVLRRHNRSVCDALVKAWRAKIGRVPEGVAS